MEGEEEPQGQKDILVILLASLFDIFSVMSTAVRVYFGVGLLCPIPFTPRSRKRDSQKMYVHFSGMQFVYFLLVSQSDHETHLPCRLFLSNFPRVRAASSRKKSRGYCSPARELMSFFLLLSFILCVVQEEQEQDMTGSRADREPQMDPAVVVGTHVDSIE